PRIGYCGEEKAPRISARPEAARLREARRGARTPGRGRPRVQEGTAMAHAPVAARARGGDGPPRVWPVLWGGLLAVAAGVGLYFLSRSDDRLKELLPPYLDPGRVVLILGGLIAAGVAVKRRLRAAGQAFEDRVESAVVLFVAALAPGLAYWGAADAD